MSEVNPRLSEGDKMFVGEQQMEEESGGEGATKPLHILQGI